MRIHVHSCEFGAGVVGEGSGEGGEGMGNSVAIDEGPPADLEFIEDGMWCAKRRGLQTDKNIILLAASLGCSRVDALMPKVWVWQ